MENHIEKDIENEMEAGFIWGLWMGIRRAKASISRLFHLHGVPAVLNYKKDHSAHP